MNSAFSRGKSPRISIVATINKGAKGTDGRGQCIVLGCVDVVYGFEIVKVLKLQKKGTHYVVITLKN